MTSKYLLVLSDSKGKNMMNNILSLKISITLKKTSNFTITTPDYNTWTTAMRTVVFLGPESGT